MRFPITTLIFMLLATSVPAMPPPDAGGAPAFIRGSDHKHNWDTKKVRDKWIPPKTKKIKVGEDKDGKPIYKEVEVKPGYWTTKVVEVCKVCGKQKK